MGFLFSSKNKEEKATTQSKQYGIEEFQDLIKSINLVEQINKNRFFYKDVNRKRLDIFSNKYGNFVNINRFCIPIIGAISCGKSTFMNFLMPFHNMLEIGENVTTKFICIIRHKKNSSIPEVYNVRIENRDENGCFNFIEDGENLFRVDNSDSNKNLNLTLSNIIKNKNRTIKNNDNSNEYKMNPENYFLIIKMNIPIFNEKEFEKYGDYIDFIDIPGLDEVKQINNFDDYILPIFKNILFPFFIFDVKTYSESQPKNILIQYLNNYFKVQGRNNEKNKRFNNGFFILNKIDCLEKDSKEENIIKDFKQKYKEVEIRCQKKVLIPFEEEGNNNIQDIKNEFIAISAKNILKEQDSFSYAFLEDFIKEAKNSEFNSFELFFDEYLNEKYQIGLDNLEEIPENKKTNDIKNELKLVNNFLKKEIKLEEPYLSLNQYIFLKEKINSIKQKNNNWRNEELKKKIQNRIKLIINDLLKFEFEDLKNASEQSITILNEIKKNIKNCDKEIFMNKYIKEFDKFIKDYEDDNCKNLNELKDLFINLKNYKENNKFKLLFLGKISSGKTSLLNSIIGNNLNILESTMSECTKTNFIIKNSNKI